MSLDPSDLQTALADLERYYGCTAPPGGQWYLHSPSGKPLRRTDLPCTGGDETLKDAHDLLDMIANAPADIAIVYGTDGHSRAVRIALEIADALARPLTLPGVTELLAAARILMDGGQGARSGETLHHLKAARAHKSSSTRTNKT